jgi:hypothetical protein
MARLCLRFGGGAGHGDPDLLLPGTCLLAGVLWSCVLNAFPAHLPSVFRSDYTQPHLIYQLDYVHIPSHLSLVYGGYCALAGLLPPACLRRTNVGTYTLVLESVLRRHTLPLSLQFPQIPHFSDIRVYISQNGPNFLAPNTSYYA